MRERRINHDNDASFRPNVQAVAMLYMSITGYISKPRYIAEVVNTLVSDLRIGVGAVEDMAVAIRR